MWVEVDPPLDTTQLTHDINVAPWTGYFYGFPPLNIGVFWERRVLFIYVDVVSGQHVEVAAKIGNGDCLLIGEVVRLGGELQLLLATSGRGSTGVVSKGCLVRPWGKGSEERRHQLYVASPLEQIARCHHVVAKMRTFPP